MMFGSVFFGRLGLAEKEDAAVYQIKKKE